MPGGPPSARPALPDGSIRHHLLWSSLAHHLESGAGDRPAIHAGARTISYARLAAAVARGAQEIDGRFRPGLRILIASRNQLDVATGFLAVLASRCVPLLADPLSRERIDGLATRFGVGAAIGDAALFEGTDLPVLDAAAMAAWWESSPEPLDVPAVRLADPAFWTFTSGTTGEPRAVVHSHEGPCAAFEGFGRQVVRFAERDVVASTAGLPFVYALGNALLFPLLAGASTILPADLLLPTVLAELERHRATVLVSGPWSLEAIVRLVRRPDWRSGIERLERVLSAGEPLPAALFARWRETFGQEVLDNLGCTEMFNSFVSSRLEDARAGRLGHPVDGYEVQVGGAAPHPGARGTLRVRGRSHAIAVSAGGEPVRVERPRDAWHETGDEVAVDDEGRLVFLGRIDDRFKVKGRFVHPVEVERVLLEVDGVRECLVVPEADEHGLTAIAAHVVVAEGVDRDELERELRRHARARLHSHLRPHAIALVDSLPRNARGKLARPRSATG
jgi:acyl-coenzyme A synthetase/AMP-(fatty) acid ligase